MSDFLSAVRGTVERHRMLSPGERVLVGVSGGPDSLALLTALVALRNPFKLSLHAAYVDHGLRPPAVRREATLVKQVCRRWGVPVRVLRRTVRRKPGESLEAEARQARYVALASLARRSRCTAIALGHTQDDQAETVLMWLVRGAGTTGLAGIPPVRTLGRHLRIVRPLIESSRSQVEEFLKHHGLRALEDRSNRFSLFLRNRIRHELIPLLERRYNPQARRHLAQFAQVAREDLECLNTQVRELFHRMARVGKGRIRLNRPYAWKVPVALRRGVLRLAIERLKGNRFGFRWHHWASLDRLLSDGASGALGLPQKASNLPQKALDLPHGVRAQVLDRRWLILTRRC